MEREKVEDFINRLSKKKERELTGHQKELIFRCFLLELTEEEIELIILSEFFPAKEEYIIASFLDDIDIDYIKKELMPEDGIEIIRSKRIDYLMEKFKTSDPVYLSLQNELEKCRQYREYAEEQQHALEKRIKADKKEMLTLQNRKQELVEEVQHLKAEIKTQKNTSHVKGTLKNTSHIEYVERVISYDPPKTLADKIKFLRTGSLTEITTENKIRKPEKENKEKDVISILCDPRYSIDQLRELQQGIFDGLEYDDIKKIAKPELDVKKIREMRKFICRCKGLEFTEIKEDDEKENDSIIEDSEEQGGDIDTDE